MKDSTQNSPLEHTDPNHSTKNGIASKENQEQIKNQNNINIVLTVIAGLFGLLTTAITAYTNIIVSNHSDALNELKNGLNQFEQKNTHSQNFAREIENSLNNISGADKQAKAKLEMIRLYTLTMSEPDTETASKDKCVLLHIAQVSQNDALKETITDLISPQELINTKNKVSCAAALMLARRSFGQEERNTAVDYVSNNSEAELLKKDSQAIRDKLRSHYICQ